MQYFTDGLDGLIRVNTDASRGSREFFFAEAEKLGDDGTWYRQRNLILEILNSGYYRPATAEEAGRIVAATSEHIPTPDELMQPTPAIAGIQGEDVQSPWSGVISYAVRERFGQPGTSGNPIEHEALTVSVAR